MPEPPAGMKAGPTRLSLRHPWGAEPAPSAPGGDAWVSADARTLTFAWDVAWNAASGCPDVPTAAAGFHERLWEHDVIELFLTSEQSGARQPRYLELEIGPAGHWLALGLHGVRAREAELRDIAPVVESAWSGGRWQGRFAVPRGAVEPWAGAGPWRALACLVVAPAGMAGRAHVTSAALPGERPDFHQPAAWPLLD